MQTIVRENAVHNSMKRHWGTESQLLRDYITVTIDDFARTDYQVYVDGDMMNWVRHMEGAPGTVAVNPVFDPRRSTILPDDAFWIRLEHDGEIVGTACNRLSVTEDHVGDDFGKQRIWGDKEPNERPVEILFPANGPTFSGAVVHEGGAWLDPLHRGRRLSGRLLRLARAVAIRNWDPIVFTGTCLGDLHDKRVAMTHYGMLHEALLLNGWCPPMREERRMHLVWLWREEALDQIVSESAREHARA